MTNIELRKRGTTIKQTMQIGKAGLTESTISELSSQLEKKELVKVKLLSTGAGDNDRRSLFERLSSSTGSELVEVRGGTALFYKQRRKGPATKSNEP